MLAHPELQDTLDDRSTLRLVDVLAQLSRSIELLGRYRDQTHGQHYEKLEYIRLQASLIDTYLHCLQSTEMEKEIRDLQALSARMRADAEGNEL